jgi:NAD(P)-dependent dehydrogenase (short-subunit alcohol dehydrogenase family)
MRLTHKVIIITGSTTGIGEAIARRCVAEGARVLIHGLEPGLGEQVAADLNAPLVIADLADPATPDDLVAAAIKA